MDVDMFLVVNFVRLWPRCVAFSAVPIRSHRVLNA